MGVDSRPATQGRLDLLNAATGTEAAKVLGPCCRWPGWGDALAARRPFRDLDDLITNADAVLARLSDTQLVEVLRRYDPIGAAAPGDSQSARWSHAEEDGIRRGDATHAALLRAGADYRDRYGYTFLIAAAGLSGEQILGALNERLGNDPATELAISRAQLSTKVHGRLRRLMAG
jgi:2-oxo-4-hydroxy-4-carboxy-5-ureidoimidazoline decarboxylase